MNSATGQSLKFFSCQKLPSGSYMTSMPAVSCDRSYQLLGAVMLALYTLPIAIHIAYKVRAARASHQPQSDLRVPRWWGVVYGYPLILHENELVWEAYDLVLRLMVVATTVLLWAEDAARMGAFALLSGASLLLLFRVRPYDTLQLMAFAALQVLAILRCMNAPDLVQAFVTLAAGSGITVLELFELVQNSIRIPQRKHDGAARSMQSKDAPSDVTEDTLASTAHCKIASFEISGSQEVGAS